MKDSIKTFFLLLSISFLLILSNCKKEDNPVEEESAQSDVILQTVVNATTSSSTFNVPNKISVTIPAGVVPNGATLKIEEIDPSKAIQDPNCSFHKIYNVTISSGNQFSTPIEISMNYDPTKIPSGSLVPAVGASYYSESLKKWITYQDAVVDKSTNKVTLKSNHLTQLSVWHRQYTYGYTNYLSSAHFNVYWKAGDPMTNTQYQSPYATHANSTDPYYVQDILTNLEEAYTAYKNNNLWVPTMVKVDVYIQDLGSVDGNSSFLGYLNINKKMTAGITGRISDVIQQTAAHEFMHYVQDYYYMQLFSDYTSKWWLEATATQADHIVYNNRTSYEAVEYADGSIQNQLHKSWDDCNSDPEFYKAGGFLSYIGFYRTGQKASIPDLIRECGNKFTLNNIRTIIDNYLQTNLVGWKGIGKEYSDYIKWALENKGAIKIPIIPIIGTNDAWVKAITVSTPGSQNVSITIPHMAAALVKIKNTNTANSSISIKATSISTDINNYLYSSSSNLISGPSVSNLRTGDSTITQLSSQSSWSDFALINTSKDNDITVTLKVTLLSAKPTTLTISPNPFTGSINKEYSFIANSKGTAPKSYKLTWNFGDQTSDLTVNNDSIAKHVFTKANSYNITVKMFDQNNVQIADAKSAVTIQDLAGCPGTASVSYAGKTYNTIQIGSQCWLRENLDAGNMIQREQNAENNGVIEKHCYENKSENCSTYGGLYQWAEAVQYKNGATNSKSPNPAFTGNVQGICPTGWHIPSKAEFGILVNAVGGNSNALKAIGQGSQGSPATNASGFSGLMAGQLGYSNTFYNLGTYTYCWSSNEYSADRAVYLQLFYSDGVITLSDYGKSYGHSVRCLKD